jgi:hypothetical protein
MQGLAVQAMVMDMIRNNRQGDVADSVLGTKGIIARDLNQVRKTPSWPRTWASFSLFYPYSHRNAWANLHLLANLTPCSLQCQNEKTWSETLLEGLRRLPTDASTRHAIAS